MQLQICANVSNMWIGATNQTVNLVEETQNKWVKKIVKLVN